jgi:hypothetical protein
MQAEEERVGLFCDEKKAKWLDFQKTRRVCKIWILGNKDVKK